MCGLGSFLEQGHRSHCGDRSEAGEQTGCSRQSRQRGELAEHHACWFLVIYLGLCVCAHTACVSVWGVCVAGAKVNLGRCFSGARLRQCHVVRDKMCILNTHKGPRVQDSVPSPTAVEGSETRKRRSFMRPAEKLPGPPSAHFLSWFPA